MSKESQKLTLVVMVFEKPEWAEEFKQDVLNDIVLSQDRFSELYPTVDVYIMPDMPPPEKVSAYCRRKFIKLCHICEDADCGDNMTPSIRALREELGRAKRAKG